MRSLMAVCDAQLLSMEEERRRELQLLRRQLRFERYRDKCKKKIRSCENDSAFSLSYDGSRLDVRVQNPLTHFPSSGGRYTTYEIAINTNNIAFTLSKSYVRRRYSEFTWFRKQLGNNHADVDPPELPPKTWWGCQFDPPIIEQRLRCLRKFLQQVLQERVYLSDMAVHLFVQTQLSIREMNDVIEGRDKKSVIEHVVEASHKCMFISRCSSCETERSNDSGSIDSCEGGDQCDFSADSTANTNACGLMVRVPVIPQPVSMNTSIPNHYTSNGSDSLDGSDFEQSPTDSSSQRVPLMCSTPRRCASDSALVLSDSHDVNSSSGSEASQSKDESDGDGTESTSSTASGHTTRSRHPLLKSVLSQSLPVSQGFPAKCIHRKRRVTFSSEVTVAKVVEKVEEQDEEERTVSFVQVTTTKGKTKSH